MTDVITKDRPDIIQTTNVSEMVHLGMKAYMSLILRNTFIDPVDGLKKVHIRALYAAVISNDIFSKKVRTDKLVSRTNELHPYGDMPTFDAIVNLSQEWKTDPPLFAIDGNGGSYMDSTTAQSRYISIELTEFAKDMYFRGISISSLPMIKGESQQFEPKYFIPAIPMALVYSSTTIGVGYQSKPLPLGFGNVCDLVCLYIQHKQKHPNLPFDYKKHIHKFLPDFPTIGYITNVDELLDAYSSGDFDKKVHMDGSVEIFKDKIIIHSLPFGNSFDNLQEMIRDDTTASKKEENGYLDKVVDSITTSKIDNPSAANLFIYLKRGANSFEVFEYLRTKYKFSDTYVPNPNYVMDDGVLYRLNHIQIISLWLKKRWELLRASKVKQIKTLTEVVSAIDATIIVLKDHKNVIDIITTTKTVSETITLLMQRYKLTHYQCMIVLKLHLQSLNPELISKYEEDAIEKRITLERCHEDLTTIMDSIKTTAIAMKHKYNRAVPKTIIPQYIGNIQVALGGYIQFESVEELISHAREFTKSVITVNMYTNVKSKTFLDLYGKIKKDQKNHKLGMGFIITGQPNLAKRCYTIKLSDNICYVPYYVPMLNTTTEQYYYVNDKIIVIHKTGMIESTTISTIPSERKNIDTSGSTTTIRYILPHTDKTFYLAILNTKRPNIIRLHKVTPETTKLKVSHSGKNIYEYYIPSNNPWVVNLAQECITRNNSSIAIITNVDELLSSNKADFVDIDINKHSTKTSKCIQLV